MRSDPVALPTPEGQLPGPSVVVQCAFVDANVVGSVGTGMVGVSVVLLPPDSADGRPAVQVWIQPADKTVGVAPTCQGPADIAERVDGDRGGRVTFSGAKLSASDGTDANPRVGPLSCPAR